MTCVIGWANKEFMLMGADSAGTSDMDLMIRADPKVFALKQPDRPDILVGFSDSFRMGQLLMTVEVPKDKTDGKEPLQFMIRQLVPCVREVLRCGGYTKIIDNREEGGTFLVGYRGKIFIVGCDFQVEEPLLSYSAIGCASSYALGAMAALLIPDGINPETRVIAALEIAEQYSAAVRRPFKILRVDLCLKGGA